MRRTFGNDGYFDGEKLTLQILHDVIAMLLHDSKRFAAIVRGCKKRVDGAAMFALAGQLGGNRPVIGSFGALAQFHVHYLHHMITEGSDRHRMRFRYFRFQKIDQSFRT